MLGGQLHALAPHVSDLRRSPSLDSHHSGKVCGPVEHAQMDLDPADYVSKMDSCMFHVLPSGQHKQGVGGGGDRWVSGVVHRFLPSSLTSGLI